MAGNLVKTRAGIEIQIDPDQVSVADGAEIVLGEVDDPVVPVRVEQYRPDAGAQRTPASRNAAATAITAIAYCSTSMEWSRSGSASSVMNG